MLANRKKKEKKCNININTQNGLKCVVTTTNWTLEIVLDKQTAHTLISLPMDEFDNKLKSIVAREIQKNNLLIPPTGVDVSIQLDVETLCI